MQQDLSPIKKIYWLKNVPATSADFPGNGGIAAKIIPEILLCSELGSVADLSLDDADGRCTVLIKEPFTAEIGIL